MAEEKEKKVDPVNEMIFVLAGLFILSAMLGRAVYVARAGRYEYINSFWASIVDFVLSYAWPLWQVGAILVAVLAAVGIAHNLMKISGLNGEENKVYRSDSTVSASEHDVSEVKNEQWERVLEHINSANASDWRLAIMEADVMLDELMKSMQYQGDSLGERLKAVEPSDMLTLDAAWEAHKIRNRIAHSAGDQHLNEREAKHAIALYESVFKEFEMI